MTTSRVTTCLWFESGGEEAAAFYLSVFANSRRLRHLDAPVDTPSGSAGERLTVEFELDGQRFMILNGGPHFTLSPAVSIVVNCDSQDEVDYFWDRLLEGGQPSQCGWLVDRFGVSWQVVPNRLIELMTDSNPEVAQRVAQAMMQMVKLDIPTLEAAARTPSGS
jgi:predicted 3-demethylubiquinone-9 3-methyltransferase (glyoxalase superfamily)